MLTCPAGKGISVFLAMGVVAVAGITEGFDDQFAGYTLQTYLDNNNVDVVTHDIVVKKRLGLHSGLKLGYLVDGITGASRRDIRGSQPVDGLTGASIRFRSDEVDGITAATPTKAEKRRRLSGTISYTRDYITPLRKDKNHDDPTTLSCGGIVSRENDYSSNTASFGISQDLFQRNTTLALRWSEGFDRFHPPQRFKPPISDEGWGYFGDGKRRTSRIAAHLTQGITTTTLGGVSLDALIDRGYLARPYYVYEITTDSGSILFSEHLPAQRLGGSVSFRLNQYIPFLHGTSLHLDYRVYGDDWDIVSQTISTSIYCRMTEHLIVRPSLRYYRQNSAFFYRDVYSTVPRYLTTDFKFRTPDLYGD